LEEQNRVEITATDTVQSATRLRRSQRPVGPSYKWIALSNTTLGALMATINSSIILIALPAIFNGIRINPLGQGILGISSGYCLALVW
jgi:hypothetical protein